jgi:hypothetical protein
MECLPWFLWLEAIYLMVEERLTVHQRKIGKKAEKGGKYVMLNDICIYVGSWQLHFYDVWIGGGGWWSNS